MSAAEIITAIFALYAAGLSTYLAIHRIRGERSAERRQVTFDLWTQRVKQDEGWLTLLYIRAANDGKRPVTVERVGLNIDPAEGVVIHGVIDDTGLPRRLEDGESVITTFDADLLGLESTLTYVWAVDGNGNRHSEALGMAVRDVPARAH